MKYLTLIVFVLVGCAKNDSGDDSEELVAGFDPPPVAAGYKRYIAPAVLHLQPGDDKMMCQWIDVGPSDDVDVLDVGGYQSATGHHAVLYSTSENQPVGESHECTPDDMVSVEFLGGIGGEGVGNVTDLPPGYVFRHRKGRMLLANTHYLNATDKVQDVQSVLDVKTAAPSAENKPAGMFALNYMGFTIPANTPSYTVDAYCKWPQDTSLVMWSNHLHESGTSIYSEFKQVSDGSMVQLATDPAWKAEWAFNPDWTKWDVSAPRVVHAGDEAHISCTWHNNTASPIGFPDEMCDAVGFYTEGGEQIVCDAEATAQ
jgi:hypothetical protein